MILHIKIDDSLKGNIAQSRIWVVTNGLLPEPQQELVYHIEATAPLVFVSEPRLKAFLPPFLAGRGIHCSLRRAVLY